MDVVVVVVLVELVRLDVLTEVEVMTDMVDVVVVLVVVVVVMLVAMGTRFPDTEAFSKDEAAANMTSENTNIDVKERTFNA